MAAKIASDKQTLADENMKIVEVQGESLSETLQPIVSNPNFTYLSDFTVVGVDGHEYHVHRVILAAHSDHFRETIFCHGNKESVEGKYTISIDIDPKNVMGHVVDYMYSTKIRLTPCLAFCVFKLADFLQMPKLVSLVKSYLCSVSLAELKPEDVTFMPSDYILELLCSDDLRIQDEFEVYRFVDSIIKVLGGTTRSQELITELWRCVRFSQLCKEELSEVASNETVPSDLLLAHTLHLMGVTLHETSPLTCFKSEVSSTNRVPFIIKSIEVFINEAPGCDLDSLRICLAEIPKSDLTHGWVLTGKSVVFGPTNSSHTFYHDAAWTKFDLCAEFTWKKCNGLLFEVSRINATKESQKGLWELCDLPTQDIRSYYARSDVKSLDYDCISAMMCNTNCVPRIRLSGTCGDKRIKLNLKSNRTMIFNQGPFNAYYKSSFLQTLYRFSDFFMSEDNTQEPMAL